MKNDAVNQIIEDFIKIRTKEKISQKQLEKLSGIPQSNISRFESGKSKNFTLKFLMKLATAMGYTINVALKRV